MPNKAVAAGGTVAFSGACTTLIIAIWWPHADATIATALTTVIAGVLSGVATWLTPHNGG